MPSDTDEESLTTWCADITPADISEECTATVGQLETCVSTALVARNDWLESTVQTISTCNDITEDALVQWAASVDHDADIFDTIPSCQVIENNCPTVRDWLWWMWIL